MIDNGDKTRATLAEQAIKAGTVTGISGYTEPIMTIAQYAPNGSTLGQDMNRTTAAGMFEAMRSLPFRLLICTVASVPAASAHIGALVYVSNGAGGAPCVAFSDGSTWKRVDTLAAISP